MFKRILRYALLSAGIMMATPLSAQAIRLAIISEGTNTWPFYAAQARKYFEQEGVTVEMTLTGSSVKQLDQLIKGGYDIGLQQSDHVVRAVENGADLFVFMGCAHAPAQRLVAAPDIGSFTDLGGKVIAVDGARSGYALLLRKLLAGKGLHDGDYAFREFGGSSERFNALKSGAAVAGFLNPPFDRNLLAAGYRSLGTTGEYFPAYPGPSAAARRSWAQHNEQWLIAFIRAFNAGYAWLKDTENKEEAIRMLPARLNIDAKTASSVYDELFTRPTPAITSEGLSQVIDIVWESEGYSGPKGAPEKYLDLSFLDKARQAR